MKPEIKVPVLVTAIQVVELLNGGTKLERILPKNQHNQRKLLNFEFWIDGKLSKIGHHFSNKVIYKLIFIEKCHIKKCAP